MHKAFWNVTDVNNRADERLDCNDYGDDFVSNEVKDGTYLLNLQIALRMMQVLVSRFCTLF
jgi:hypothetical protein